MPSPLQGALARTIGKAAKRLMIPIILERDLPGTYDEETQSVNPASTETWHCRGFVENYSEYFRLNSLVEDGDRKVMILASTLTTVPKPGDRLMVRGETFRVKIVEADPAQAVYKIVALL